MADIDLNFLAAQQRAILDQLRVLPSIRDELALLRGEFQMLREQVRIQGTGIDRINDTLLNNVLDRIRRLENNAAD